MNQSLNRSLTRSYSFPNSRQVRQQRYCRLAYVQNNRINLKQQGLDILDQYDFAAIVTIEGVFRRMPPFINDDNGQQINYAEDTIWISKYPIYSSRLKRYILTLRVGVNDQFNLGVAHCFCSLISNVVIVAGFQESSMKYLTIPNRFVKENPNQLENSANIKSKISALVGLSQNSQFPEPRQNFDRFSKLLEQQGVQKAQLARIYPIMTSFQFPSTFPSISIGYILSYIEDLVQRGFGNQNIIIHGPIIEQYANILAQQYNRQSLFKPVIAQDQIEVQQGFQEYLAAVDVYNQKCKQYLGKESHTDVVAQLQKIRNDSEQKNLFKNNSYYSAKLSKHMDRKEAEIISLNQQLNDTYNLELLKKQANKSLDVVTKSKNSGQTSVSNQLDKLIRRYNQKARGNNSQKLLSQFLQIFVPTMYAQAGASGQTDKELQKISKQNKKLQQQLNNLQKKNAKGKCCTIM